MNIQPSFMDLRSHLALEFSRLRSRAWRAAVWSRVTGKKTTLARFPEGTFQQGLNRRWIGIQDICVDEIVGTLYRHTDFDANFRPLKKNLRDRWINIHLLFQQDGWPPILAHKVGDHYYIEDGHHRVSVARALGLKFIQAQVWDHPGRNKPVLECKGMECPEARPLKKYAPAID